MSKQTPECEAALIEAISHGMTKRTACRIARISEDSLARWLDADTDFAERLRDAERERERFLLATYLGGLRRNPALAKWLLQVFHPDTYANRVRVSGPDGGPIQTADVSRLSDDDLDAIVAQARKMALLDAGSA